MDYQPIARFLAGLPPETQLDQADPDAPRVVFKSVLELDRDQEEYLTDVALRHVQDISDELGRDVSHDASWFQQAEGDSNLADQMFLPKRQLAEMTYNMRMEWRSALVGGIFEEHNLTVPLTRRIVQQQHARANGYFFSTDPWFAVDAVGSDDDFMSDKTTKYGRYKFSQLGIKDDLMAAVESAFKKGEQVLKPAYVNKIDVYEQETEVGVLEPGGEPVFAQDGDYIFRHDTWVGNIGGAPIEDEEGNPQLILARDMKTTHPGTEIIFELRKVTRTKQLEKGVEIGLVYYRDFLCSLSSECVQSAPAVAHIYDKSAFDIVHGYMADLENAETGVAGEDFGNVIEMLNDWSSQDGVAKAHRNKSRTSLGEMAVDEGDSDATVGEYSPVVEIAEVYLYCDPVGDGQRRHIMILLDLANERPIYYDYLSNVTPDGKRPFHVVRINPVEGRWHGIGQCETFSGLQEFADLTMNRWSQAQSGSGHIDIVNADAVEEGDDDGNIEINAGDLFHLKNNAKPEDFITRIQLYEHRQGELQTILEWIFQLANSMGGVSNTNDAHMSGLDSGKLATGIRNIEKSGQELFAPFLSHCDPGLTGACASALMLLFDNLDEPEIYEFFEGDIEEGRIRKMFGEITPEEVKDITINIKLELTRYKSEAQLAQTMQAEEVGTRYYGLPFLVQQRLRDLFVQQLKALQIQRADEMIVPTDLFPVAPPGSPGADQAEAVGSVNPVNQPPQAL